MIFDIGRPLIMAHRGESGNTPENTIISLEAAAKIGVDVLESDIHLTNDNIPILFHDDNLLRTTGVDDTVREKTLDELLQIDLGYTFSLDNGQTFPFRGKGLKVITLEEALVRFPDTILNFDIKDPFPEASIVVARVLQENLRTDKVIVASFHPAQLKSFRKQAQMIPTAAYSAEVRRFILGVKLRASRLFTRSPAFQAFQVPERRGSFHVVTPRFVKAAHDKDLAVHVWTINEKEEMERFLDLGVDGIFTDYPAILREVFLERGLL